MDDVTTGWEVAFKIAGVIVPVFMAIIMTGIAYLGRMIGTLQLAVSELRVAERELNTKLHERTAVAGRDHAIIDRRLDEHDNILDRHGERIGKLEAKVV